MVSSTHDSHSTSLHTQPSTISTVLPTTTTYYILTVKSCTYFYRRFFFPDITFPYLYVVCPSIRLIVDSISFHFFSVRCCCCCRYDLVLRKKKLVENNDSGILLMNWSDFIRSVCRLAIIPIQIKYIKHLYRLRCGGDDDNDENDDDENSGSEWGIFYLIDFVLHSLRWQLAIDKTNTVLILCCAKTFSKILLEASIFIHRHIWHQIARIKNRIFVADNKANSEKNFTYLRIK